jgi:ferric iron reductase protein FhuF
MSIGTVLAWSPVAILLYWVLAEVVRGWGQPRGKDDSDGTADEA